VRVLASGKRVAAGNTSTATLTSKWCAVPAGTTYASPGARSRGWPFMVSCGTKSRDDGGSSRGTAADGAHTHTHAFTPSPLPLSHPASPPPSPRSTHSDAALDDVPRHLVRAAVVGLARRVRGNVLKDAHARVHARRQVLLPVGAARARRQMGRRGVPLQGLGRWEGRACRQGVFATSTSKTRARAHPCGAVRASTFITDVSWGLAAGTARGGNLRSGGAVTVP
jgi:hypothetical protein